MKKLILSLILALALLLSILCGCGAVSGVDGRDGQDLSIYEIYEAANAARVEEGLEELSFLEFLTEYLQYDFTYSEQDSVQAIMNRSLMSSVAIVTGFKYNTGGWSSRTQTDYYVGSGVIVDIDKSAGSAYILTNCHVVYDDSSVNTYASEVYVFLYGADDLTVADKEDYIPAEIAGATVTYDLALLKVENSEILKNSEAVAATFAEEEEVYAGANVYAVGNPEGCGIAVTRGIISRESESIAINLSSLHENNDDYSITYRVIRTDAAVNGGNSGGGLYDYNGKLVGIINSKLISEEVDNMGYALAGSYVKRIWPLLRDGSGYGLQRAVFPASYTYTSSAYFDNEKNLAVITDKVIVTGSSFSGLMRGDVIKRIKVVSDSGEVVEDMRITRHFNVDDVILSARKNYKVIYTILRGDSEREVTSIADFEYCK